MALTYKIKSWDEASGNVLVGFAVTDDTNSSEGGDEFDGMMRVTV